MPDCLDLEQLLETMVRTRASTLHLMVDRAPCMRLQGKLVQAPGDPISQQSLLDALDLLVPSEQRQRLDRGEEIECLYTSQAGVRFRCQLQHDAHGLGLSFRRVPKGMPSFDDLGLPQTITGLLHFRSGLVLVTGFFGSGKSLTLAALVNHLNQTSASHIVTIEQPIEYVHEPSHSIVHQREVGRQTQSFAAGVRDASRQSADVVMVGDLPDAEAVLAAIDAAESGCLVIAGFQASGVAGALEQVLSGVPAEATDRTLHRLSAVLRVVVSQALLHRAHGKGRVPLLEILINNQAVAKAIQQRAFHELPKIMDRSHGLGMQTVDRGLKALLDRNLITMDEALYHATDREWMFSRTR